MDPTHTLDNRDNEPSAAAIRAAAEWLAHLESGDASEQDLADFAAWRSADETHVTAFDRLGGVRDALESKSAVEQETMRRLLLRPKRSIGGLSLVVLTVLGVGWAALRLPGVQLFFADEKTFAGEMRTVELADGSRLTLSTQSAVDIGSGGRRITLLEGEILARVAKRQGEDFTVRTDDGSATALGTAFTVRKEPGSTIVAVAESRILACPSSGRETDCLILQPGQSARITVHKVDRLPDMRAADVGAWSDGWLSVEDRPLVEVLDELNRWRTLPIAFDRTDLANLSVSGSYPLREPEKATANLLRLLPVVLDTSDPAAPVLRRRR